MSVDEGSFKGEPVQLYYLCYVTQEFILCHKLLSFDQDIGVTVNRHPIGRYHFFCTVEERDSHCSEMSAKHA